MGRFSLRLLAVPLTAFALAVSSFAAIAQGILIPRDDFRGTPFFVKSVRVNANIMDAAVETVVEQVFVNNSSAEQEGTYLFPLPDGATVTSFSLKAGDRTLEGRLLTKEEARGTYESIVRRRKDPALLEYVGRGLFRASVFPIPAHGDRTLTLKYVETLKPEGGMRKFTYPLSTGRFSNQAIETSSVSVRLKTSSHLKTVYSPTHDVSVRRNDETSASASWEGRMDVPDRDFILYFSTNGDDVGLSLLTQPTGSDEGYFMLVASPRVVMPKEKVLPRQIVFVLDRTGSMKENNKMEQAKSAMKFCLNNLGPKDLFNVITFNEAPDLMSKSMLSVNQQSIDKAQRFVSEVDASGGTNIDAALQSAMSMLKGADGAQRMVVFLTDGLPTVGETNIEKILLHVQSWNNPGPLASSGENRVRDLAGARARIFCFGVGYDVNVPFLDRLAEQNRAEADYVRPTETVEGIVSSFFSKITSPVLANLNLNFDGVDTYDVYPKELPDLFKGGQMVITGRYRSAHGGSIRLAGYSQGQQSTFKLDNAFGDSAATSSMVSRIWATRKIGYLLDQVRLHADKEVIDEIIRLSKEHGIVTPYTSYLADERLDRGVAFVPGGPTGLSSFSIDSLSLRESQKDSVRELEQLAKKKGEDVGGAATARALNSMQYKSANQAPSLSQGGFGGGGGGGLGGGRSGGGDYFDRNMATAGAARSTLGLQFGEAKASAGGKSGQGLSDRANYLQVRDNARVQNAGNRVFYKRGEIWFDNNYQSGQKVVQIQALSDAHFALMRALPELNHYAAVGDEVVLNIGKSAVQIGKVGKTTLTPAELKEITGKDAAHASISPSNRTVVWGSVGVVVGISLIARTVSLRYASKGGVS